MKRLIYQVYVGAPSNLYDHCVESVANYCLTHGFNHIVQRSPILMIKPDPFTSGRSTEAVSRLGYLPIFEKENAFDYLDRYDQIAIIDSDVWIRPNSPSIFDDILPEMDMAAVIEQGMPLTDQYVDKIINYSKMQYCTLAKEMRLYLHSGGYSFCNMGVMVLNKKLREKLNGMSAKQFIQQPKFKDFVDGKGPWKWSTDQTLLNYWMQTSVEWQQLDWKWNGLYSANTQIKQCHFVHFFLKDKLPNRGEDVATLMRDI